MRSNLSLRKIALLSVSLGVVSNASQLHATEVLSQDLGQLSIHQQRVIPVMSLEVSSTKPNRIVIDLSSAVGSMDDFIALEDPSYALNFSNNNLTPSEISQLVKKKLKIVTLDLSENPFGKEGSVFLPNLKSLEELSVKACTLYDDGVAPIGSMLTLKKLNVEYNGITIKGIEHLMSLSSLEELYVGSNYLKNDAIKLLTSLSSLKIVDLSMNELDDNCISDLLSIPALQYADITDNNFTPQGIEKLRQAARSREIKFKYD